MLSKLAAGRAKYGLKKFLRREANTQINKLLFKSTRKTLANAFRQVGVRGDVTVCVHASLSGLGYIEGGASTVVDALLDAIGNDGCLVMPAFSMEGSMEEYLHRGETFEVRTTPSRVGAIAEAFRKRDGVLRSLHPTNSLVALGRGAAELLKDHDASTTPYGMATPYGRMAEQENAYILMINTHVHSLLHHIQERVDFPNLFLDGDVEAHYTGYDGQTKVMRTRVMRPRTPYYVAVPAPSGAAPDWALLHDFSLVYPKQRDKTVAELGYRFDAYPELQQRRQRFLDDGTLTSRRLGRGEIGLLNAARFVRAIQPRFEDSIGKYRSYYDVDYIKSKNLPFG
jgi:aminoglycoside 3-N-acetyltransferase